MLLQNLRKKKRRKKIATSETETPGSTRRWSRLPPEGTEGERGTIDENRTRRRRLSGMASQEGVAAEINGGANGSSPATIVGKPTERVESGSIIEEEGKEQLDIMKEIQGKTLKDLQKESLVIEENVLIAKSESNSNVPNFKRSSKKGWKRSTWRRGSSRKGRSFLRSKIVRTRTKRRGSRTSAPFWNSSKN